MPSYRGGKIGKDEGALAGGLSLPRGPVAPGALFLKAPPEWLRSGLPTLASPTGEGPSREGQGQQLSYDFVWPEASPTRLAFHSAGDVSCERYPGPEHTPILNPEGAREKVATLALQAQSGGCTPLNGTIQGVHVLGSWRGQETFTT
jgi:hypothetical protein